MTLAKSAALQIYSEDSQRGLDLLEGWAFPKIGEILAVNYGKGLKKAKRVPGPVSVYGSNGVVGKHNIPLTHGPTIILGRKGTVGAVHFSKVPCWPIDTTYFIDDFNGLAPRYLVYALRRLNLPQLDTSTAIPGLNRDELYSQYVPLAPIAEQKRMVAKVEQLLARVNAARERLAKVPEILKRFRQAILAAACSGRLTADWRDGHLDLKPAVENLKRVLANRRTEWETGQLGKLQTTGKIPKKNKWKLKYKEPASPKLSDLPELPDSWYWATIEQLAAAEPRSIQSGPFGSNLLHSEFQDTGILAVGIDNVLDGKFSLGKAHRISNRKYEDLKKYAARPLDVLITVMATVGRCCVLPEDIETAIITKHVYRITVDRNLMQPHYLMLALRGDAVVWRQINDQIRGQTRPGINGQILKNLAIPTPPSLEQTEIVRRVGALFKLADAIGKRVAAATAQADKLTQAILAKAFRGELVPTEAELARLEGRSYEPASALLAKIEVQWKDVKTQRKRGGSRHRKNK